MLSNPSRPAATTPRRRPLAWLTALCFGIAAVATAPGNVAAQALNTAQQTSTPSDTTANSALTPPSAGAPTAGSATAGTGQVNLRSPTTRPRPMATPDALDPPAARRLAAPPYVPGEFETYVQKQAGADTLVRRFGADLVTDLSEAVAPGADSLSTIPADYLVRAGDEIAVTLWGSVDADLLLTVDRSGRVVIPRVGAISVGGVRHAALTEAISQRVAQTFRNFQLTASLSQARPIRVYVTGFAQRPGSLTLSGLSTVTHALLRAGGPSAAGSFRHIELRRSGKVLAVFDLYDLLLRGDRQADLLLQPDDVLHIGPVGSQVALIGSVNQPAIFELSAGETLHDLLKMAGGFNAVADRSRAAVERLNDRTTGRVIQINLDPVAKTTAIHLGHGDLVRIFSAVRATLPQEQQNKRVRVEGEVQRPGDYVLPAGASLLDAVRAAQGLTAGAYVFGTELTRESVRELQAINYERALRDLEDDLARNNSARRVSSAEESAALASAAAANTRLIERLRQAKPSGRVVMQVSPDAKELPEMALEDGDRIVIPPRNSTVGVFGSVFSSGSYVFSERRSVEDYLRLAGGPKRGADTESMFLIRANGTVISARQGASHWRASTDLTRATVLPGDTLFVPEEMNKSTFVQDAKDWTQILYQFGLGLAGIKTLGL